MQVFLYCTARKYNFRMQNELELAEQSQKTRKIKAPKMELLGPSSESAWWEAGIDPIAVARKLWD